MQEIIQYFNGGWIIRNIPVSMYGKINGYHGDNITVINSKTLCGPHRYLVDVAVKLVENR